MFVKDGGITDILSFIVHVYSVHVFIASTKQLCFPFGEGGGGQGRVLFERGIAMQHRSRVHWYM